MKKKCPLCQSDSCIDLNYGGYEYHENRYPLVLCKECGLKYIVHNLNKEEVSSFYKIDSYFESEYGGGASRGYISNKKQQENKANFVLKRIKKYFPGGRLLEIGAAGGFFLKQARDEFGYDVTGVEISEKMCRHAKRQGFKIYCGEISNIPSKVNNFDVVFMGDVLEHVSSPNGMINQINNILNKKGLLALELPLTYNLTFSGIFIGLLNLFRGRFGYKYFLPPQHRTKFINKPPYHLLMFNSRSIKKLAENNKLNLKYLNIYEGRPKEKANKIYGLFKILGYYLTVFSPLNLLGDRMLVVFEKN